MQQRQIEEGGRGQVTNLLLPSIKIVRSPVDLTSGLDMKDHRALLPSDSGSERERESDNSRKGKISLNLKKKIVRK